VGLALWARCTPETEGKLERGMVEPENRLALEDWNNGETVWLVDLIAPFADGDNRHREIMIADLISGPLAGTEFKFHQTDPQTGQRSVRTVDADAGEKLKQAIEAAANA
jgi:cytolysin-activating lysine-acyltransferase